MTPDEARRALRLVTGAAASEVGALLTSGLPPDELSYAVLSVVSYYSDGSSALAADFYDEQREQAAARGRFRAEPIVPDRTEKIRRGALWAVGAPTGEEASRRVLNLVTDEVGRPFQATVTGNTARDPETAGWKRITRPGACKFCLMLADKGAIYRKDTVRFAAHGTRSHGGGKTSGGECQCTAAPVFKGGELGPEADVLQYAANGGRIRTDKQRERLRNYLNGTYPDAPG